MPSRDFDARLRELLANLRKLGFTVLDATRKRHRKYRITAPNGHVLIWTVPSTPSDRRAWLNGLVPLRRFLIDAGCPDGRKALRVSTEPARRAAAAIWDDLDALDACVGPGRSVVP